LAHKFSEIYVPISEYDITVVTTDFLFTENFDEKLARVSNGKRMSAWLWPDFKTDAYFDYDDAKMTEAYGNTGWAQMCGPKVGINQKQMKQDILTKEGEIKELRKQAKSSGVAPPKRRRRL
jgi:hypothetical protein